jgi:hypothetical protein
MRKMKFNKFIIAVTLIATFASCSKRLDSLLDNPNLPSPSTADVDLYLNAVQLNFNGFWNNASDIGAQLSRQQTWFGPLYRNAYQPASFDGMWTTAYTGVIKNADALIPLAQKQNKFFASGIAKVLKAYTYGTMVDMFGDIPFSEANLGDGNTNPKADGGASVYAGVLALLDAALVDFGKTSAASPTNDLYYGGNKTKWVTLTKTLKLKFLMQTRLVDASAVAKIQALLTENDLIKTASQDFVFQYGTSLTPDSRHPHYASNYVNSGGVGDYLSNYFMWLVGAQKYGGSPNLSNVTLTSNTGDPRLRYYFYRQVLNSAAANSQTLPCFGTSQPAWYPSVPDETPYCYIGRGFWGRDHGDASGAPPDGDYRTAWGVYPAGGQYDANQGSRVSLGLGSGGKGINPIWLASFTEFLQAEAALKLNITTNGDAKTHLLNADSLSIDKVTKFPAALGQSITPNPNLATQIANYKTLVGTLYDNAATIDDKLNVVMTEYHIALWGNGIEPYNNLRRTGMPFNVQLVVYESDPGYFMRSWFYPSVYIDRNSNAPAQKKPGDQANKVFWDNNPDNFIK